LGQRDLAVDLGTANTLVFERGRGIIVSEPSVVAVDSERGDVYAVGAEAHRMIGRTPANISATRPLRHGVIADFEVTEQMLRYFLRKAHRSRWARQRVVMCVPSGVTDVETRAVEEACRSAGAREVALIEEPIAAAIGAGLDIAQPTGHMVVDIGGGTSEVAVLSMGEIVVESSLRLGGYDLDEAIMAYVRREHNLAIGQPTAEEVKLAIGAAGPVEPQLTAELRGRELVTGLPKTVTMTTEEARQALAVPVEAIVEAVRDTLDRTPPELSSDILSTGILLAGGGALLHGLEQRLHEETQMPTYVADSALTCVAEGAGQALEEFEVIARRHAMRSGARRARARARRGARTRT
jgi:rod shape-determining protein MreB